MSKAFSGVSRRQILAVGSGVTLLPLASLLEFACPVPSASASDDSLRLTTFDPREAALLQCVSRTLFPHDFLDDRQYMKIVATLDSKAAADKDVAVTLRAALERFPDNFAATVEAHREDYLRSLEGSVFFKLTYQETLAGLYGDPVVAALLGDEGSSIEHGGYLQRGFDDLSWLPADKAANK